MTKPHLIPCPGECGGQAVLEPAMTVTRNGVTTVVTPATCKRSCTMEVTRGHRRPVTVTVPRRFEIDPREQPGTRKDEDMIAKKQMAWCDEQDGPYAVPVKRREPSPEPDPAPETAIAPTPKSVAIPHDSPQEHLQRKTRPVETGNAFRAFLEPMLVELVRERLAAINEELAEQVEIRVLLEMPA